MRRSLHRQRGWFWLIPIAISAVSAIAGASAKKKQKKQDAANALYEAAVREQEAQATLSNYNLREEAQRRRARHVQGQLRASLAQSGIGYGTGTALDVEMQSAVEAEMDALNIRYEGQLKSRGLLRDSEQQFAAARAFEREGRAAQRAGAIQAGASVLSGVGSYLGGSSGSGAGLGASS